MIFTINGENGLDEFLARQAKRAVQYKTARAAQNMFRRNLNVIMNSYLAGGYDPDNSWWDLLTNDHTSIAAESFFKHKDQLAKVIALFTGFCQAIAQSYGEQIELACKRKKVDRRKEEKVPYKISSLPIGNWRNTLLDAIAKLA